MLSLNNKVENKLFIVNRLNAFQQIFLPVLETFFLEQKREIQPKNDTTISILEKLIEFTLRGGKRIRPALLYYCYQGFTKTDINSILPVTIACELMQSFLLIHDDIMDEAELRRNGKTIHHSFLQGNVHSSRYAESMAILIGNIAGYLGIEAITKIQIEDKFKSRIIALYAKTCIDVGYGQALDITPQSFDDLIESKVYDIYIYKTARYTTEFPLLCAGILSKKEENILTEIKRLGKLMGILFQIRDDISGLFGDSTVIGKSTISDIQQSKKTLLICKAWGKATFKQRKELQTIYGKNDVNLIEIKKIKDIVISTGALEYAEGIIQSYAKQSKICLNGLKLIEEGHVFIEKLIDYWS